MKSKSILMLTITIFFVPQSAGLAVTARFQGLDDLTSAEKVLRVKDVFRLGRSQSK